MRQGNIADALGAANHHTANALKLFGSLVCGSRMCLEAAGELACLGLLNTCTSVILQKWYNTQYYSVRTETALGSRGLHDR